MPAANRIPSQPMGKTSFTPVHLTVDTTWSTIGTSSRASASRTYNSPASWSLGVVGSETRRLLRELERRNSPLMAAKRMKVELNSNVSSPRGTLESEVSSLSSTSSMKPPVSSLVTPYRAHVLPRLATLNKAPYARRKTETADVGVSTDFVIPPFIAETSSSSSSFNHNFDHKETVARSASKLKVVGGSRNRFTAHDVDEEPEVLYDNKKLTSLALSRVPAAGFLTSQINGEPWSPTAADETFRFSSPIAVARPPDDWLRLSRTQKQQPADRRVNTSALSAGVSVDTPTATTSFGFKPVLSATTTASVVPKLGTEAAKRGLFSENVVRAQQPPVTSQFKPPDDTWSCDTCYIRNKGNDQTCVACQSSKPGTALSFSNQDKKPISENKWSCPICFIKNRENDKTCAACQGDKPGTAPVVILKDKRPTISENLWSCPTCFIKNKEDDRTCAACRCEKPEITPAFKKPTISENMWSCPTCFIKNKESDKTCAACQCAKPGGAAPAPSRLFNGDEAKPPSVAVFPLGIVPTTTTITDAAVPVASAPSATVFSFGKNQTTPTTSFFPTGEISKPLATVGGITPASLAATDTSAASGITTASLTGAPFGVATTTSAAAAPFSLAFGTSATGDQVTIKSEAKPFSFMPTVTTAAAPASTSSAPSFAFPSLPATTTATSAGLFKFGADAATTSASNGPQLSSFVTPFAQMTKNEAQLFPTVTSTQDGVTPTPTATKARKSVTFGSSSGASGAPMSTFSLSNGDGSKTSSIGAFLANNKPALSFTTTTTASATPATLPSAGLFGSGKVQTAATPSFFPTTESSKPSTLGGFPFSPPVSTTTSAVSAGSTTTTALSGTPFGFGITSSTPAPTSLNFGTASDTMKNVAKPFSFAPPIISTASAATTAAPSFSFSSAPTMAPATSAGKGFNFGDGSLKTFTQSSVIPATASSNIFSSIPTATSTTAMPSSGFSGFGAQSVAPKFSFGTVAAPTTTVSGSTEPSSSMNFAFGSGSAMPTVAASTALGASVPLFGQFGAGQTPAAAPVFGASSATTAVTTMQPAAVNMFSIPKATSTSTGSRKMLVAKRRIR